MTSLTQNPSLPIFWFFHRFYYIFGTLLRSGIWKSQKKKNLICPFCGLLWNYWFEMCDSRLHSIFINNFLRVSIFPVSRWTHIAQKSGFCKSRANNDKFYTKFRFQLSFGKRFCKSDDAMFWRTICRSPVKWIQATNWSQIYDCSSSSTFVNAHMFDSNQRSVHYSKLKICNKNYSLQYW